MYIIDKNKPYSQDDFSYHNFIHLSPDEIVMVLNWRNHPSVRKWMLNTNIIEIENHLNFINSLKDREDCYYWLVYRNSEAVGVVSVTNIDNENLSCESGFYLNPERINQGDGFDFTLSFQKLIFMEFKFEHLVGIILKTNKYAIINALFFGAKIIKEVLIADMEYYITYVSKKDFCSNLDIKADKKQFAQFVYSIKKGSISIKTND